MVFEKAASNFRQTIRSDPTMQYVHANLGSVLVKLGKHTVAGPVLVKAVDRDKTDQKGIDRRFWPFFWFLVGFLVRGCFFF